VQQHVAGLLLWARRMPIYAEKYNMCTLLKYAKNAAIAYSHKTDMPRQWHVPVLDWLKAEVQEEACL